MSNTVYQIVTDRIIKKLEAGTIPWRKPWNDRATNPTGALAINYKTQKAYRGVNQLLLEPGEYATYKQVQEAGGQVRRGSKGEIIVFWKWLEDENNPDHKIPLLRYYTVFNIATQCDGIKSKHIAKPAPATTVALIAEAEAIVAAYPAPPSISFAPNRAYYRPSADAISVPPITDYPNPHEYYSTLYHELVHSTGHHSRLNRSGVVANTGFGTENYSREELIAECGAAMLCAVAGIDNSTLDNSAAYIAGWLSRLQEDPKLIVQAAAAAQKAADHILNLKAPTDEQF